jgi:hypothetical protein
MVVDREAAYGAELYGSRSRETVFKPGSESYRLISYPLSASAAVVANQAQRRGKAKSPRKPLWEQRVPIRITSLVRAADGLFVAGSPDVVDPDDPHGAWEGRKGGVLAAFDTAGGEKLAQVALDAPPVWDGMAATDGRLFIATMDGRVVCLGRGLPKR